MWKGRPVVIPIFIVRFLALQCFATCDMQSDYDLFFGKKSFNANNSDLVFAKCYKDKEQFEKVCFIVKYNDIFSQITSTRCTAIFECRARNTVVGSNIKVVAFGDDRAIVMWWEKYVGASTPKEVLIRFSILKFSNCQRRDYEISAPLENNENPDDALDKIYYTTNDADSTFLAFFYDKSLCGNKICKRVFNVDGNDIESVEPWFGLENGTIRGFVPLKNGDPELGFLAFNDVPETYLVDKNGSHALKLDIYSDKDSKVVYSFAYDSINLCYHTDSSVSCGRFTRDGKLVQKRRFRINEKIESSGVYYAPKNERIIFVANVISDSCKEYEILEHITLVNDLGMIQSISNSCLLRNSSVPQFFRNENNADCWFSYVLESTENKEGLSMHCGCLPSPAVENNNGISEILKIITNAKLK